MNTINHNLYADTYLYNVIAAKSFENAFPPYKDFTVILSKSFYDFLVNDGDEFNDSCIAKFYNTEEGARTALCYYLSQRDKIYQAVRKANADEYSSGWVEESQSKVAARIRTSDGDIIEWVVAFPALRVCYDMLAKTKECNNEEILLAHARLSNYGFPYFHDDMEKAKVEREEIRRSEAEKTAFGEGDWEIGESATTEEEAKA